MFTAHPSRMLLIVGALRKKTVRQFQWIHDIIKSNEYSPEGATRLHPCLSTVVLSDVDYTISTKRKIRLRLKQWDVWYEVIGRLTDMFYHWQRCGMIVLAFYAGSKSLTTYAEYNDSVPPHTVE